MDKAKVDQRRAALRQEYFALPLARLRRLVTALQARVLPSSKGSVTNGGTIHLDKSLSLEDVVSALAHEIGHATKINSCAEPQALQSLSEWN